VTSPFDVPLIAETTWSRPIILVGEQPNPNEWDGRAASILLGPWFGRFARDVLAPEVDPEGEAVTLGGVSYPRCYFSRLARANILALGDWDADLAAASAHALAVRAGGRPMILLGRRVADAFARWSDWHPWDSDGWGTVGVVCEAPVVSVPHPSGRSREWNDPRAVTRARDAVRRLVEVSRAEV